MATLIIDEGSAGERRVVLEPGVVTVGRREDEDVAFPEDETLVSPLHASLHAEHSGWFVRDEGSTYGTFLNDRRVKEHGLQDGDLIELGLGGPRMRFVEGDAGGEPGARKEDTVATEVREAFRPEDEGG